MKSDIHIAQETKMLPIMDIANKLNISDEYVEQYGKYKAKISLDLFKELENKEEGNLILVTAITPTPSGEGKSTVTVGLTQALNKIGKNSVSALREPSLGPVFGLKGGATGGGYSQVIPMEDINLHFTGDLHAITSAHNLISACIDNHLNAGNELNIDVTNISWKRVVDMNDRALRNITIGLGGKVNGIPRESSFQITVASEIMAILCLATSISDLKTKISNIIIGFKRNGTPVTVDDLKISGAVTALLKEAIKPNLVQTLENTPVFIHGGPFANIAHGCNSIMATKLALKTSDYTVTEAGFGADLGAEKFLDIKCQMGDLKPNCIVVVATIRALKHHGEASELNVENLEALKRGICNLDKHIENMQKYNVPVVVAINKFIHDTDNEIEFVKKFCKNKNIPVELCEVWEKGGEGGIDLANTVVDTINKATTEFRPLYSFNDSIENKINKIAKEIYGAKNVAFSPKAKKMIEVIQSLNYNNLPICVSKTQKSFSDNPNLLGKPVDFTITINEIRLSAGAGFIVAMAGSIIDMPGLPKSPSAEKIDINENGIISGLF